MRLICSGVILGISVACAVNATGQTTETVNVANSAVSAPAESSTLSSFLTDIPKPAGPNADTSYSDIPPELEQGVRYIAMDNFTSATENLLKIYDKNTQGKERAQVAMWLGLGLGIQAINYPDTGWKTGTSATQFLKEAIAIDPAVFEAPDTARVIAEMVAHGWANEDPATALKRAEQKAEETRRPLDFYFAGVISRRLAARAWGYSDTTDQDKKTLSLFAKSLARDPARYETWSAYLPALLPSGLHDLATTEAKGMYEHFKNLRTPLLGDQGPAVLMINNSSWRTMRQDEGLLHKIAKERPHAPMPPFELGMRAIESTPPLAMKLFPEIISRFESGDLKPTPREAGYYPSALYKYGFLLQSIGNRDDSIATYKKVRELSPGYAEVNLNLCILYAQKADEQTTGPEKLESLEKALKFADIQDKLNYHGKTAAKSGEMGRRLRSIIYRQKLALKTK